MITLKTISTGSKGNSYALMNDIEILLLDLGVSEKDIVKAIDYRVSDIACCVVTHGHLDHAKSVKNFSDMGIDVWKPYEQAIKKLQARKFGDFEVTAFPMLDKEMEHWQHTNTDGTECPCYGFYICHRDMGKMVYITDTKCVSWDFSKMKLNHVLISSNYDEDLLEDNAKKEHVLRGHLSVQYVCEKFIKPNKSNALRNIVLCHLSHDNSDKDKMVAEVQKVSGMANVDVAEKGKCWELSLTPF